MKPINHKSIFINKSLFWLILQRSRFSFLPSKPIQNSLVSFQFQNWFIIKNQTNLNIPMIRLYTRSFRSGHKWTTYLSKKTSMAASKKCDIFAFDNYPILKLKRKVPGRRTRQESWQLCVIIAFPLGLSRPTDWWRYHNKLQQTATFPRLIVRQSKQADQFIFLAYLAWRNWRLSGKCDGNNLWKDGYDKIYWILESWKK